MRGVLITWAAAWPTITVLLLLTRGVIAHWPLAAQTLLLTGVMVPLVSLVLVPMLKGVTDWGEARFHAVLGPRRPSPRRERGFGRVDKGA